MTIEYIDDGAHARLVWVNGDNTTRIELDRVGRAITLSYAPQGVRISIELSGEETRDFTYMLWVAKDTKSPTAALLIIEAVGELLKCRLEGTYDCQPWVRNNLLKLLTWYARRGGRPERACEEICSGAPSECVGECVKAMMAAHAMMGWLRHE